MIMIISFIKPTLREHKLLGRGLKENSTLTSTCSAKERRVEKGNENLK